MGVEISNCYYYYVFHPLSVLADAYEDIIMGE